MKNVELHPEAIVDADAAFNWYADDNLSAAFGFRAELHATLREIGAMPTRFPRYVGSTQRAVMSAYPYAIVFRDEPNRVFVFAVAHGRRNPDYWKHRLKDK